MADFDIAFRITIGIEGKYSNNKKDPGGETMYGITKRVARKYGYKGKMKDLPLDFAKNIYKVGYWNILKLDKVSDQGIANELFDTSVNMGVGTSAKFLQRTLNALNREGKDWRDITVDGKIGPVTINILTKAIRKRRKNIYKTLNILQGCKYISLAEKHETDEDFINGWLTRVVFK